jgi:hypothetical protein
MEIELQIDGGRYPIQIQFTVDQDGKVFYYSEYLGTTISTFPSHHVFKGESLEESIELIATGLRRAIQELLEQ